MFKPLTFFGCILLLLLVHQSVLKAQLNNRISSELRSFSSKDSLRVLQEGEWQTRHSFTAQSSLPTRLPQRSARTFFSGKICYTVSGRNFLYQDSILLWTGDPSTTKDGNVLISGEWGNQIGTSVYSGAFCMKTDPAGNVIWAKLYDSSISVKNDYINFFQSLELSNGNILLAGRGSNNKTKNDDLLLALLDKNGNVIWCKGYESAYWQGFHGSGDSFGLKGIYEDPDTGEIYFVGDQWISVAVVTKVDPTDGRIIWSNAYKVWNYASAFGLVINKSNLSFFQIENDYYSNLHAIAINKANGDTLYSKVWSQVIDPGGPAMYRGNNVVKLNNGHFVMSGPTTHNWEYPKYTGTVDLYHAAVVELDENFNLVRSYGFKNRLDNISNVRVSLFPDGTGVFTALKVMSGYSGEGNITLFKNGQIYHQRKRLHKNEGLPYEPPMLQMNDGGFLNIKLMGDSTVTSTADGCRIDYYQMHTSDTASVCIGVKDSSVSIWNMRFNPQHNVRIVDSIRRNVFKEIKTRTLVAHDFTAQIGPACQVVSYCDSLKVKADATTVCLGSDITITLHKNKECGSLIPLNYDTAWVNKVTPLTDSTYAFRFDKPGSGYIHASLLGCSLREDSVLINVLPVKSNVSLGKDTVICPQNTIKLNAGEGFATYQWQDGSSDSILIVNKPGTYHVAVINGCGSVFRDTVIVNAHAPVSIDLGADLVKCNNDTIRLTAPAGYLNYSWSNNYNINSVNTQTVKLYPLLDTAYYIKAEKEPGCFAHDTINVKVNYSPKINLGADTAFCMGDSIVLDAGVGFSQYKWNSGSITQQLTVKTKGTYSVSAAAYNGCNSYDTIQVINVFSTPVVMLDHTTTLCAGTSRILDAGNFSTYAWSNGGFSRTIAVNDIGKYFVEVKDQNGCVGSDTTIIKKLFPLPVSFLPADTAICSYGTLSLQSKDVYQKYLWNNTETTASITISKPGTYWLQVEDINSCTGRDSVVVTLKDCMKGVYIPSAFTPNGDGRNDVFKPVVFGDIKKYTFSIYNRWGGLLFQTTELNKGWDGTLRREPFPLGTYAWVCTYQFAGEEEKTEKGTVTLIR